jgi:hypothetical protein
MAAHRWKVYRSGGVDQVAIGSGADLAHLDELDPKLWIALSMPTRGVELDSRTLDLLDRDHDGFVRHAEILEAIVWLRGVYRDLAPVIEGGDAVELYHLQDGPVLAAAKRLLANLGKADSMTVSLADASSAGKAFERTQYNGDGVIVAEAADGEVRAAIEAIGQAHGTLPDRSGKPGIDAARIDAFFTDAKALVAWQDRADAAARPLGDATPAAAAALAAVRGKVDDYFTRCRLAAFDPRAAAALNAGEAELAALAGKQLSSASAEVAQLPLARVEPGAALPLGAGLNPAWQARVAQLRADALAPLVGARDALDEATWQTLCDKLAPYDAWLAAKPTVKLDALPLDRVRAALAVEAGVRDELAKDLAVAPELERLEDVERLCRYQRDLATLLNNYVNFSRFYSKKGAVFQTGTLYLDARACNLVFDVTDAAKHAAMAPMAGSYLAYCDCVRAGGEKKTIAAALTAGDVDNLFVGRNGVYVDRKGRDWQATITKIIDSPISIRQAFWSPYKKLVRAIEERVAKRAAAEDVAAGARLDGLANKLAGNEKPAPEKPAIDVGTVAALGVAVGGIAAVLTAIFSGVFRLGPWAPIALVGLMVAVSTPSMVLAFIKLRRRNLGPLLDANGWAINALTRINIPFGTALTDRPMLPAGAERNLKDPYAEKRRPWGLYLASVVIVTTAASWYLGKLDRYLPQTIRSTSVLGAHAPAAPADAKK